jgi:Xaa-Pro aminopeptidase
VLALFFVATSAGPAPRAQVVPYHQTDFPPEEFKARWTVIFDKIGEQAVAVLPGASQTNGFIFPRQTNDFYYLCGIETPQSYLLLDGRKRRVTLYLPPRNLRLESAEGKVLSADDVDLAKSLTGADDVLSTDAMRSDWLRSAEGAGPPVIYTGFAPGEGAGQSRYELKAANAGIASDSWDGRIPREAQLVELLRTRFWRSEIRDYHNYVSDITRMWPAGGKYSPVERELLGFVLTYRNTVMQRIRPGLTPAQIQQDAKAAMEPVVARTKFSKPIYEQAAHKLVDTGGGIFSHPVGMAVHDDGDYANGPLKPGQVFSIDPQLRVPEENRYLRYEDVIVITPSGYENFTAFLPTELDDIEKLVGEGGVLQKVPAGGPISRVDRSGTPQ